MRWLGANICERVSQSLLQTFASAAYVGTTRAVLQLQCAHAKPMHQSCICAQPSRLELFPNVKCAMAHVVRHGHGTHTTNSSIRAAFVIELKSQRTCSTRGQQAAFPTNAHTVRNVDRPPSPTAPSSTADRRTACTQCCWDPEGGNPSAHRTPSASVACRPSAATPRVPWVPETRPSAPEQARVQYLLPASLPLKPVTPHIPTAAVLGGPQSTSIAPFPGNAHTTAKVAIPAIALQALAWS